MMLVGVVLGVPAISALIQIVKWGGPQFYIYVWLFLLAFSLFVLTLYPTLIAPLFNKFTPLEEGELKSKIEKLASSINYPLYKLLEMDGSKRSGHRYCFEVLISLLQAMHISLVSGNTNELSYMTR